MVWHGSTYILPQDRSFRGTLYFFGQVDSVPRGLAVVSLQIGQFVKKNKKYMDVHFKVTKITHIFRQIVHPHHHHRDQCRHSQFCQNQIQSWFMLKSSFYLLNWHVRVRLQKLLYLHWIPFKNWLLMDISVMKILRLVFENTYY